MSSKQRVSLLWILVLVVSYGIHFICTNREFSEVVETKNGKIRGFKSLSRGGRVFTEFRGIPYAKAPVGKLRFQSPVPIDNWNDIYTADKRNLECIQIEIAFTYRITGQEDCLHLNVFTPIKTFTKSGPLLPVIIFIHGGGFISGSTKDYGGNYFMDEDVVVVTINYRLGALGFLNTGDTSSRGNMGLKDQQLAMQWVQQNVASFGGDPNRVNLIGQSAGAASVHLHLLSAKSQGLFQKATMLSGNAYSVWAKAYQPISQSFRLGRQFGCNDTSSQEMINCLQEIDPAEISAVHCPNRFPMVDPIETYGPSVESIEDEETFLSESPENLMVEKKFVKIPIMSGVNRGEGLINVARILQDGNRPLELKNLTTWLSQIPRLLVMDGLHKEIAQEVTDYYFKINHTDLFDPMGQLESITNMYSDRMFFYYHQKFLRDIEFGNGPLYSYYYTYSGYFNVFKTIMMMPTQKILPAELHLVYNLLKEYFVVMFGGSKKYESAPSPCHGDEIALLFDLGNFYTITPNSKDYAMSTALIKMVVDFTKDGKEMKFHGESWPSFTSNSSRKTMRLDDRRSSKLINAPYEDRLKFWKALKTSLF